MQVNYDLPNQDKVCPDCKGTGWVGDYGAVRKGNTEIAPCDCGLVKPMLGETTRKVSDLTIAELKDIILWCFDKHEKIKQDKAVAEWKRKYPIPTLQKEKG